MVFPTSGKRSKGWNCRGDLLAASPDGCTTVLKPGKNHTVAHNEDGLPFFKGSCFIVEAAPKAAPGFRSFCYPGSLPGHTFAVTERNLIQTINNLRLRNVTLGAPRMVLARAVLGAGTLDQAVRLLNQTPSCGGFHMTLADPPGPARRPRFREHAGDNHLNRQTNGCGMEYL